MMSELAYVLSHGDEAVTDAVVRTLERGRLDGGAEQRRP